MTRRIASALRRLADAPDPRPHAHPLVRVPLDVAPVHVTDAALDLARAGALAEAADLARTRAWRHHDASAQEALLSLATGLEAHARCTARDCAAGCA